MAQDPVRHVLTLQDQHRSREIWDNDGGDEVFVCRHHLHEMTRGWVVTPSMITYLRRAGFYTIHCLSADKNEIDRALITALVERWREETHTFHFSVGEATITLRDVAVLLGLRVHGPPLTESTEGVNYTELCVQLLGVDPREELKGSSVKLVWLRQQFGNCAPDADDITVQRHTRAYILTLLGGMLFADKKGNKVQLIYLLPLRNWEQIPLYSWGSATLAFMYRQLCRSCEIGAKEISGPLMLLQLWSWEHISIGRPCLQLHVRPVVWEGEAYGCKWIRGQYIPPKWAHTLCTYRQAFDHMTLDKMTWDPYTDEEVMSILPAVSREHPHIWRARVPLINFDIIEWHFPDRVMHQFGMVQHIPQDCDSERALHSVDKRGKSGIRWMERHQKYVAFWATREGEYEGVPLIVVAEPMTRPMSLMDPYMVWFRRITRRFILPSSSKPSMDHVISSIETYNLVHEAISKLDLYHPSRPLLVSVCHSMRRNIEQAGAPDILPPIPTSSTYSSNPIFHNTLDPSTPFFPSTTPPPWSSYPSPYQHQHLMQMQMQYDPRPPHRYPANFVPSFSPIFESGPSNPGPSQSRRHSVFEDSEPDD